MGIFSRLSTLLKSNINDVISNAEDPEKILNQLILDMKEQLIAAKKQVASAIADEKRLHRQYDKEAKQAKEWERKAMMAIRAGRDDLAKEALQRKTSHDTMVSDYKEQWMAQKKATDQLRAALRMLSNKIEEAGRKKNLLIARKKRAEAQKTISNTLSGLNESSAFDAFDRMTEKIEKQEAEAEASAELANELSGNLSDKFSDLEAEHGTDDSLAALKAKMGLARPAPAPAAPSSYDDDLDTIDFDALERELGVPAKR